MTDEHDIDVLGYFPREERDSSEWAIIRELCRTNGELIIAQIKLSRELGPSRADVTPSKQSLWRRLVRMVKR